MIAAYIRVSSRAQTHDMQRHAIEQAAALRGETIGHWYADKASGKSTDRPGLKRMRADVLAGRVSRLYVYRIDRLTRTGIRDTLEIVEECQRAGCHLVNLADGFEIGGPAGEVILAIMAWAAKMERLAIVERLEAARERIEAEGGKWGRPASLENEDITRVLALRDEGQSIRAIAAELDIPRSVVGRLVSQKCGKTAPVAPVENAAG